MIECEPSALTVRHDILLRVTRAHSCDHGPHTSTDLFPVFVESMLKRLVVSE